MTFEIAKTVAGKKKNGRVLGENDGSFVFNRTKNSKGVGTTFTLRPFVNAGEYSDKASSPVDI